MHSSQIVAGNGRRRRRDGGSWRRCRGGRDRLWRSRRSEGRRGRRTRSRGSSDSPSSLSTSVVATVPPPPPRRDGIVICVPSQWKAPSKISDSPSGFRTFTSWSPIEKLSEAAIDRSTSMRSAETNVTFWIMSAMTGEWISTLAWKSIPLPMIESVAVYASLSAGFAGELDASTNPSSTRSSSAGGTCCLTCLTSSTRSLSWRSRSFRERRTRAVLKPSGSSSLFSG